VQQSFFHSELGHPHTGRARAIIKAHPEVRQLMGRNPWTLLIALVVVSLQTGLAFLFGKLGFGYWWLSLLVAYGVGAFANHSMYVLIHDAIHNLILPSKSWNKVIAIFADLPNLLPGAMGFGIYHLKHHSHQGDYEYDADLANQWEAKLVGNRWYAKAIWLLLFPIVQLTRPPRIKALRMWNRWIFLNLICALAYDAVIVCFCGWSGLFYLFCSFAFSIGLHPVGARWIQEHYTNDPEQETYSYYGPINRVCLNMGYHNEHHDFPTIPWNNLPRLRALAPDYYDTLKYHPSWSGLLFQFIFDPEYTLFCRVERTRDRERQASAERPRDARLPELASHS
jgi:sphingolipid delta-4 desaturase